MALQGSGTCREVPQSIRMVTHTQSQQGAISAGGHIFTGYSTIDNAQIQPTAVSLAMVPALVQAPQTIVSTQGHNMGSGAVPPTSTTVGMQPLGHVILRSPKEEMGQREQERRIRREIANSNERRRMQSINSGFKSLKSILPHTDGEKLSKAAILQQTSEYITQLESDKLKLMHQNEKLRRAFADCKCNSSKHRALADIFEKDEGIGSPAEEDFEDMRRGLIEVRQQLDRERRMKILYQEQVRNLESQLYPDRMQSMKLSSDERRSSSECSPSASKPVIGLPMAKIQPCARPLLPPLAPLFTAKLDKPDGGLTVVQHFKPASTMSALATQNNMQSIVATPSNLAQREVEIKEESNENGKKCTAAISSSQSEQLVTVFSHSTKSNQPLKKRAIEIHHQSLSDSGNDSGPQQPKRKVAKITIDQPPEIGTRSFLPPTLPPIPAELNNSLPLLPHSLPTALPVNKTPITELGGTKLALSPSSLAVPNSVHLPNSRTHQLLISPPSVHQPVSQVIGSQYVPTQASVATTNYPTTMNIPASCETMTIPTSRVEVLASPPMQIPVHSEEDVLTIVGRRPSRDGGLDNASAGLAPVYLTVAGVPPQGTNIAYVQRDDNKLVQLAPTAYNQPHFIMAPVSNTGTVFVTASLQNRLPSVPPKASVPQVLAQQQVFQHGNTGAKIQPAVITYQSTISPEITASAPSMIQQSIADAAPTQVAFAQSQGAAQTFLQTSGFPKFQSSLKMQSPQTLLCYTQPEITLNQLNAVPNFPPRSLHQPGMLPVTSSLLQPSGSDSPSYISPALQESGVPTKPGGYLNPAALRCRKSSMSATDSCSTASVSGAEDDEGPPPRNPLLDDPDGQSEQTIPTIKLPGVNPTVGSSPTKSPPRGANVAAYDEVSQDVDASTPEKVIPPQGLDVADCRTPPPTDATVSVLSSVAGSPPVIRHIDAIQTRRNLETIVQAIDHLEQQERRNSQDQPDVAEEGSSH